jgi:ABC-type polysaccharide/polyol phosphate transport system ATPase subunit
VSDDAIVVDGVSKRFRIPLDRGTTLKYRMVHWRSSSRHREFYALRDINLSVARGEFLGVVGHNGSGKSTLLKILAGIYPPTTGKVHVNGRVSPFLELGVGFNPELTARENVFLNGAILGVTRAELERRVDGIIDFADLSDRANQKLKNFSSGMMVRLAFSVGDASFQEKCFRVFEGYRREGRTVVLVTHDLSAVQLHCQRAVLVDGGQIVADGAANEVTNNYVRMVQERDAVPGAEPEAGSGTASEQRTGDFELLGLDIIGPDGRPARAFPTGGLMTIQLHFAPLREVGPITVGFAVRRPDGTLVAATRVQLDQTPAPHEALDVRYVIDRLPLVGGDHLLDLRIGAGDGARHDIDSAIRFRVVNDDADPEGTTDLGGSWEVRSGVTA